MFTKEECEMLNERLKGTMCETLGIKFLPSDDDIALAEMPINKATRQYFGILHGGASLALAETVAGAGSLHLTDYDETKKICGTQVSGNHIAMSDTKVRCMARALCSIAVAHPIYGMSILLLKMVLSYLRREWRIEYYFNLQFMIHNWLCRIIAIFANNFEL